MKQFNLTIIVILLFIFSCTTTEKITTKHELRQAYKEKLVIYAADSTVYRLNDFVFRDSIITGIGTAEKNRIRETFDGQIEIKDISEIHKKYISTWKTIFMVSAVTMFASTAVDLIASNDLAVHEVIGPQEDSCPFIYTWNKGKYVLEGEAFGAGLGKGLETATTIVLNSLSSDNDILKIKITNERPETHFFNNIKFVGVETELDATIYADNNNNLKAVSQQKVISKAYTHKLMDIKKYLISEDSFFWESDLSTANKKNSFEDKIYIELKDIERSDSISLIITAINSHLSSEAFSYIQALLGDEYVNFTYAANNDEQLITGFQKVLERISLKFDVWDGGKWKYIGLIHPEANGIEFKKLIRLPALIDNSGRMKIRIRTLTDSWKIDAVYYDDEPLKNFKVHEPELISFKSNPVEDFNKLLNKDDLYIKLLPEEWMNLEFKAVQLPANKKITYAVTVGGYLYEYVIDKTPHSNHFENKFNSSEPKLLLVKNILNDVDAILPVIYEQWKRNKDKLTSK
jgi:hypothetical protein